MFLPCLRLLPFPSLVVVRPCWNVFQSRFETAVGVQLPGAFHCL